MILTLFSVQVLRAVSGACGTAGVASAGFGKGAGVPCRARAAPRRAGSRPCSRGPALASRNTLVAPLWGCGGPWRLSGFAGARSFCPFPAPDPGSGRRLSPHASAARCASASAALASAPPQGSALPAGGRQDPRPADTPGGPRQRWGDGTRSGSGHLSFRADPAPPREPAHTA